MNRELKFRIWDKEDMDYIGLVSVIFGNENKLLDNQVVMQYTGLNDKNGKEIYEGDIIEGGYLNPLGDGFVSKKYVIEYDIEKGGYMGHIIGHRPYGDTWI